MKKFASVLLCLCCLLSLPFCVSAAENRVRDDAGLLYESEIRSLNDQIHEIKDSYQFDIVIVTTTDLGGLSAKEYADSYYDYHSYGCGNDRTGVLLLVDMGSRQWYISTCGEAIYALDDYALDHLEKDLVYFLSSGEYYGAFECFVNSLPKYFESYRQGDYGNVYNPSYDYDPYYPENSTTGKNPLIAVGVGLLAAVITILIMRSSMNTAKRQREALDYQKEGSYHLHTQRDMFLYSRTSRTRKQQSSGSSSGHRSSGGSHGGRGGRF